MITLKPAPEPACGPLADAERDQCNSQRVRKDLFLQGLLNLHKTSENIGAAAQPLGRVFVCAYSPVSKLLKRNALPFVKLFALCYYLLYLPGAEPLRCCHPHFGTGTEALAVGPV